MHLNAKPRTVRRRIDKIAVKKGKTMFVSDRDYAGRVEIFASHGRKPIKVPMSDLLGFVAFVVRERQIEQISAKSDDELLGFKSVAEIDRRLSGFNGIQPKCSGEGAIEQMLGTKKRERMHKEYQRAANGRQT
jgi:hypothetical protein